MTTPIDLTTTRRMPGTPFSVVVDEGPDYLSMPKGMATYQPPPLPEPELLDGCAAGLDLLRRLHATLARHRVGQPAEVLDLAPLDLIDRQLVDQTLGEGEVSVIQQGLEGTRAQETRLAGVWRLHVPASDSGPGREVIEVSEIPSFVRETAFADTAETIGPVGDLADGVMNAPALIVEIEAKVAEWRPGTPTHIINLTLLPMTEQDHAYLDERLGRGHATILSRGYGSCRIVASGIRQTWWVQHFNSDDRLILSTLEVTDVPIAALAAQEDIDDSRDRLAEILETLD
ncbi:hydrogenase expression/formation protein [Thiocapsa marina]|uniref:HupH hydrogenase expression protein n=1 Tax=Thiocapsa marina 5811 TaxID=768671 RepID=F9U5A7_9GAMM|nr:hydrogenase expression/formation protein [Thiocapsa marina]EGV20330.1 HupH hydrogenase expression protein [Thiocapsa marina 5811]